MHSSSRLLRHGVLSLLNTANATKPFSVDGISSIPSFALGWPISELPLHFAGLGGLLAARTARIVRIRALDWKSYHFLRHSKNQVGNR